jgi:poly-gamma-glutamate synthesis protein (capsule biosynthesis protein)
MQGLEFYKGKPIAYSLSNFWFSRASIESALLKLYLDNNGQIKLQLLPAMAKDTYTYLLTDSKEKADYYDFIKRISFNIDIDDDGFVKEAE